MDRTERFHLIDRMLNQYRLVSRDQFLDSLEVSPATFKRDLEYLRDRLAAPIIWDAELRGYRYDQKAESHYQLPGLWFNTAEIQALLTMDALLENLQPGMLSNQVDPLRSRIHLLLEKGDHSLDQIRKRIRIMTAAAKPYKNEVFQSVCQAVLTRYRLDLDYYSRQTDSISHREVSPQRLTYYRDNWYLDAWCHWRNGLRSFSLDAIKQSRLSSSVCHEVGDHELDLEFQSGYGIFSGVCVNKALLKFSPAVAPWVSQEQWHPEQSGKFDEFGFYWLNLPYSQDTELIMDLLRHGAEVEVVEPDSLRVKIKHRIKEMSEIYAKG
jgi:predicted DNA-binding transcriptional regulator YafY